MNVVRAAIGVGGLALLGLILWAIFAQHELHGGFFDQVSVLTTLPWGIVSLADLYLGFALFAVVVFLTERSLLLALFWALPVFVFGNVWAAVWFVVRLPLLVDLLSRRNWPDS